MKIRKPRQLKIPSRKEPQRINRRISRAAMRDSFRRQQRRAERALIALVDESGDMLIDELGNAWVVRF